MAEYQFQTEVNQLLKLIIHSMYSNKDIFLREIISNASDAIDKLNYLKISDESYKDVKGDPRIDIFFDTENRILTVRDNGIAMDEKELNDNLGTIAQSGTKYFFEKSTQEKSGADSNLIGQFGVGFYSAFMAAKIINVYSRKPNSDKIFKWSSDGISSYQINELENGSSESGKYGLNEQGACGTAVEMILNDDSKEFTTKWRIEDLVKRYSDHIAFPIYLHYSQTKYNDKGEDEGTEEKCVQINSASALWKRPKSELKDEDYANFYKTLARDSEDPLLYVHTHAEGVQEYTTLFYIPKKAPVDLYQVDYANGIKLYVKRVFITDGDRNLLPSYLRFVKGVIDSEDLPLNVSREILQQNRILENIKYASVKKLLGEIKKLGANADEAKKTAESERNDEQKKAIEDWNIFVNNYNRVMKEGIYTDFRNRNEIFEIVRFKSTDPSGSGEGNWTSMNDYVSRMKPDQKAIYMIIGSEEKTLRNSPSLEAYVDRGYEVLIASDQMDDIILSVVDKYKDKDIKIVDRFGTDEDLDTGKDEKKEKAKEEIFNEVSGKISKALEGRIDKVALSKKLTDSPSCVTFYSGNDYQTEKILRSLGQDVPEITPILEINVSHPIITRLRAADDEKEISDISEVLLDQSLLMAGAEIKDSGRFVKAMNALIGGNAKAEANASDKSKPKAETNASGKAKPKAEANAKAEPKAKADSNIAGKAKPKAEAKTESKGKSDKKAK